MKYHCLTFREPFGSLAMAQGMTRRFWDTNIRGDILIGCARKPYGFAKLIKDLGEEYVDKILEADFQYQSGFVIGLADLVACRPMTRFDSDKCFAPFNPRAQVLVLENVRIIDPFIYKANHKWTNVDYEFHPKIDQEDQANQGNQGGQKTS